MSSGSGIVRDVTLRLRLESAGDVQLPDWTRANGGAAAYFGTMNQGATAATQNVNTATGAVNNLGQGLQQGVTELDLLLASATNFDQVSERVRQFAEQVVSAFDDLDPEQRAAAIEQIMTSAREQFDQAGNAAQRAGQRMSQNMTGAMQSMMQAATAGGRLVASIGMLTGNSDDIEELARRFVHVQMTMQAMSAGSQMFTNMSQGLVKVQAAATAAQVQLSAVGTTATFTQAALIRLGPAAASLQAALGPIGLALSVISLTVMAVQTAMALMGDSAEEAGHKGMDAVKAHNDELENTMRLTKMVTAELDLQAEMREAEFKQKLELSGGVASAADLRKQAEERAADNDANTEQAMKEARQQADKAVPQDAKDDMNRGIQDLANLEREKKNLAAGPAPFSKMQMAGIAAQTGLNPLALPQAEARRQADHAAKVKKNEEDLAAQQNLNAQMERQREKLIDPTIERKARIADQQERVSEANQNVSDVDAQLRLAERKKTDADKGMEKSQRDYEGEVERSQKLQRLKEQGGLPELQAKIKSGSVLGGIDAMSPYLSQQQQAEMKNKAANGELSKDDMLSQLGETLDLAPEREANQKAIEDYKKMREEAEKQANELQAVREEFITQQKRASEEMAKMRQAMRQ